MKKRFWLFLSGFALASFMATLLSTGCSTMNSGDELVTVSNYGYVSGNKSIVATGIRTVDTNGDDVFGSGGCILQEGKYFYWYGEHRFSDYRFKGVSCYRSTDLVNWENRGDIVTWQDAEILSSANQTVIVERPKVVKNPNNGKYVMWGHLDYNNYGLAAVVVCQGNSPDNNDGSWEFVDWFRPFDGKKWNVHDDGSVSPYSETDMNNTQPYGFMSRDCTLFVDDDGKGYFASSYNENAYMHIYRLTDDFLHIDESYWPADNVLGTNSREAPCLFREGDVYYMVSSGTAGWTSTVTTIQYAYNLQGPWSSTAIIGDTTYAGQLTESDRSQPAYVLKLEATDGSGDHDWLYMGDRWGPAFGGSSPYDSQYVWCKLNLNLGSSYMYFSDALEIDIEHGKISSPTYYQLESRGGSYLQNPTTSFAGQNLVYSSTISNTYKSHWRLLPVGDAYMIINRWSGMVLSSVDDAFNSDLIVTTRNINDSKQLWYLEDWSKPYYRLKNVYSGLYCTGSNPLTSAVGQSSWAYRNPYWTADSIIEAADKNTRINYMAWQVIARQV